MEVEEKNKYKIHCQGYFQFAVVFAEHVMKN